MATTRAPFAGGALQLLEFVGKALESHGDAPALLAPGREPMSYAHLYLGAVQMAGALRSIGIGQTDQNERVAVVLPDGPEMVVSFLGISSVGAFAPLNPNYRASEFEFYLTDLNPKALVVLKGTPSPAVAIAQARGIRVIELIPQTSAEAGAFTLEGIPFPPANSDLAEASLAQADDVALILHTSGTTSRPKMVPLTHANLHESARNIAHSLALTGEDRCLNIMPLFHVHGLVGAVLSSLSAGAGVICTPGFHAKHVFDWFDEFRPTWYTAVPTMHQAILAQVAQKPGLLANSRLRFVRSCSSALPAKLMADLEAALHVPVVEAYGMTEASHQMAINPLPPGVRKAGSVGRASGCEIAILNDQGDVLTSGEVGAVAIRGAGVTRGYENNPEANQSSFAGGWFRTGDQGKLDSEGYLYLTGRLKEIINRGGEKISPREVDEVLLEHPAVAQAMAFALPDEKLGEDVAAAVVLRPGLGGGADLAMEIREFVAARVAHFKVPRQVVFVDEIPKGPTGKPQRIGLAEKLGLVGTSVYKGSATVQSRVAPRTETEMKLAKLWRRVLELETEAGIDDDFFAAGGDSISAVQFCSQVQADFGVELAVPRLFETPTIAALAAWIDSARGKVQASSALAIVPAARTGELPLSYGQRQYWFLDKFEEGGANFIRLNAFRLRGPLDVRALQDAIQVIVGRHEILRTTYHERDGVPVQTVGGAVEIALTIEDLSTLPEADRLRRAHELAQEEAWKPFDLSTGPLLRTRLLKLSAEAGREDYILFLTLHHIAADGWSYRLILQELSELYTAQCAGRTPVLPVLGVQYADFALAQQKCFQTGQLDGQIAYWKKQLAGAPELLSLPTDRPRPSKQSYRGGVASTVLPRELGLALKGLALEQRATLYMLLLAAYQVLLHRHTGEADLVVGSPIAGRTSAQTEPLIGLFSNVLAMRANLSGDPSFIEMLARTREATLGALANQDVPTEKLIEQLALNRDAGRPALFQVLFQLRNLGAESVKLGPVTLDTFDFDPGSGQFDLSLYVRERPEGLYCALNYNSDLYDGATAERILGQYQTLLAAVAANPQQSISRLKILPDQERQQVLVDWNQTAAEYPDTSTVHELIAARARATPNAVAVKYNDEELSYGELDRLADIWAQRLRGYGVHTGAMVGISLRRSPSLAIAVLAVLKAGAAYVPLDPDYPGQRLAVMLADAQCSLVITNDAGDWGSAQVLSIENTGPEATQKSQPASSAAPDATPRDCAYVIFTSGSTGQPNGVLIEHRSLVNLSHFFARRLALNAGDRVLQFNSLSFDTAAEEIFPCWMAGATLVFWPERKAPSIVEFLAFVERERITILDLPTAYWHEWVSDLDDTPLPSSVRAVVIGGEKANASKVAVWSQKVTDWSQDVTRIPLYNTYGPTEATITTTICELGVPASSQENAQSAPIGRPIANATLYILDSQLQPVPIGVPGELYIGGAGVARGYLKRPELTAARFIANPFVTTTGPAARLYKTGDRVRYLADGSVEFLGRADDQVKWRGFRIELGELENAIGRHPEVRAVACSLDQENGLLAYVAAQAGVEKDPSDLVALQTALRSYLKECLPDYMQPSRFVFLDRLPLTPSGKVDRRALPTPERALHSGAGEAAGTVAPRTEIESEVAGIWEDVLGRKGIGVHDNFFDLGGHSLKLVQVLSRIQKSLGVAVPLRRVFERPTVEQMAVAVLENLAGTVGDSDMAAFLDEIGATDISRDGAAEHAPSHPEIQA